MKQRNSKLPGKKLVFWLMMIMGTVLFSSCKKDSVKTASPKNVMAEAARAIDGEIFIVNLTSENSQNALVINCGNSNKIIRVEKLPNSDYPDIREMKSAEVIISNYGIILKDLISNKTCLFINNDAESITKFRSVQSLFTGDVQSAIIFGTTVVNSEGA